MGQRSDLRPTARDIYPLMLERGVEQSQRILRLAIAEILHESMQELLRRWARSRKNPHFCL